MRSVGADPAPLAEVSARRRVPVHRAGLLRKVTGGSKPVD